MMRIRIGLLVVVAFVSGFLCALLITGPRRPVIQVTAETPQPNEDGLVVKVAPLGEAEIKDELARTKKYAGIRFPLGSRALGNPLLIHGFKVSVENASGKDVEILCVDESKPFRAYVVLQDYEGEELEFSPFQCTNSLKDLRLVLSDRVAKFKPEEVAALRILSDIEHVELIDGFPRPGKYTARAVCGYRRASDGEYTQAESAPITVVLTDQDIREWRFARTVAGILNGDPRVVDRMEQFINNTFGPFHDAMPKLRFWL